MIWRLRPIRRRTCISCPLSPGLGAPHWDAEARGAIYGMTRNTGPPAGVSPRAALEAVCYQTRDLLDAMHKDWKMFRHPTRCSASMAAWWRRTGPCSGCRTSSTHRSTRPTILETTALGAAWLAGQRAGVWPKQKAFAKAWARDTQFKPKMDDKTRAKKLKGLARRSAADAELEA